MILTAKPAKDRRIQKTQRLLREALASLIREKPYDSIVVKQILDYANVGRSTFYAHFRDKDDLLVNCIHDMLRSVDVMEPSAGKSYETTIGFSLPVFEHIHRHMHGGEAKMDSRSRDVIHQRLCKVLADLIVADIREDFQGGRKEVRQISPDLLAQYLTSTFILVLNWWLECTRLPPKDANDVFRALVLPTLAGNFE